MFGRTALLGLCFLAAISPDAVLNTPHTAAAVGALTQAGLRAPTAPENAVVAPAARIVTSPTRLLIPKIGVDAKIEARGLDSNRNMETPNDSHDVAWYDLGPRPGEPGNALINGHVTWWTGSAVFARLG